jgi:hypothetical protein
VGPLRRLLSRPGRRVSGPPGPGPSDAGVWHTCGHASAACRRVFMLCSDHSGGLIWILTVTSSKHTALALDASSSRHASARSRPGRRARDSDRDWRPPGRRGLPGVSPRRVPRRAGPSLRLVRVSAAPSQAGSGTDWDRAQPEGRLRVARRRPRRQLPQCHTDSECQCAVASVFNLVS